MLLFKIIEKTAIDKFMTQELLIEMQYNLISSILISQGPCHLNKPDLPPLLIQYKMII